LEGTNFKKAVLSATHDFRSICPHCFISGK